MPMHERSITQKESPTEEIISPHPDIIDDEGVDDNHCGSEC